MTSPEPQQQRTACNRDCPDACSLIATVVNDKVIRLRGDPDHPVTQGFLCRRTNRFLERQYDPDRITTPLMKRGATFEPVSWDVALEFIAEHMLRIRAESGPAAIMHYRSGGSMGMMKFVTNYFFERFGPVTIKSGNVCSGAGDAAQLEDFGDKDSHDLFDLLNSRTILVWGKNLYVSSVHMLPVIRDARRRGARLLLIDPVFHRTANLCDHYVQPRAGGDMAIALGVARLLFENNAVDPHAATYCDHLDDFRSLAFSRTIHAWAGLADVQVAELEGIAGIYRDGPSSILVGWGLQRRHSGSATIRVLDALAAISGNLGIPGGGVFFSSRWLGRFDTSFTRGAEVAPRTIPEPLLGPGILAAANPPLRMIWVSMANPVAMLPDSLTVRRALQTRELTVVVDSFLTDTARCADVVLPTTTMLEDDDLLGSYGHHWIVESRPVVAAPRDVRTDYEIVQALAPRVGLGDEFTADVDSWKRKLLRRTEKHGASLDEVRCGPVRDPLAETTLFVDRRFPTPTGRVNLIREVNPVPPDVCADRPLTLMTLSTEEAQASQWLPGTQEGPAPAIVHPDAVPGFADGDLARMESEVSEIAIRLKFDPRQRTDLVLIEKGGWLSDGRCVNALIPARSTDAGGCAVYNDTPVRILAL
ncbi:MAG: molybdopterin-containing oxidoreductase catalytic subunit [Phycisphaeraceae bacterium]|nr:molybdopterin-containing oxidoreductase catalytic subunit [Phycisphaeraceae bacterium]